MKNLRATFLLICFVLLFFSTPALAAETAPGDACTTTGVIQRTGGPEQMPARTLVCDGATWKLLAEETTSGQTLLQIGNDTGSCTAEKTGRMRYNSSSDLWEYCDGSDPWTPFKKPLCLDDDTGECTVSLTRSSNDPDFIASNIANGINILGVVGTMTTGTPVYTSTITKVARPGDNTCYLTNEGRIFCWGQHNCDQYDSVCTHAWGINIEPTAYNTGVDAPLGIAAPTEIDGHYTGWTALSTGDSHACGIRGGAAYCWGWNKYGGLGIGTNTNFEKTPTLVSGGYTDWVKIDAGGGESYDGSYYIQATSCALRSNGRLYCWGANYDGQLGTGNTNNTNAPTEVSGAATDWANLSVGMWHTCGLKTTGRLYCWGWNGEGQMGRGNTTSASSPIQVSGSTTDWAQVSAGYSHTCAVKTTGRLYCWGQNRNGELGTGATSARSTSPVEVSGAATDWATVVAGTRHTCAIKTSGRLYCWGFGGYGALGDGTTTVSQTTPSEVSGGYTDWVSIDGGGASLDGTVAASHDDTYNSTCGVRSSTGLAYCWGDLYGSSAGDGIQRTLGWNTWADAAQSYSTTPVTVMPAIVR
ncbi:RCC1 domain-containing protein [Micavibrio aeruginosavorus]|uniref:RCC1 domain-containing protein n=1 Tax=Micavibrio aeruginosavorus TaxID=349221 RepID=UPI003F4AEBEE